MKKRNKEARTLFVEKTLAARHHFWHQDLMKLRCLWEVTFMADLYRAQICISLV